MAGDISSGAILGGAGISAGAGLVGAGLNYVLGNKAEKESWQRNYNAQKEFAQNSIQWRVQDAQKAGVNPIYAMGNTPGFTPQSSFNSDSLGNAIANAGNAFGEAMGQIQLMNLMLQNKKLESETKSQEIDNVAKTQAITGQTQSKIPAPKKVGDRIKTEKAKVSLAPETGYLNEFKRYGNGWIGYPNQQMLDALSEASVFNPMSLPVAVDAVDAMYRNMEEHFSNYIESAIPGISNYGHVESGRYWRSYGRPVYEFVFDKRAPKDIVEKYRRFKGL